MVEDTFVNFSKETTLLKVHNKLLMLIDENCSKTSVASRKLTYSNYYFHFIFSFMSRLMTGVLMHHLAWVPTVMPAGATPSRAFLDKHSSTTVSTVLTSQKWIQSTKRLEVIILKLISLMISFQLLLFLVPFNRAVCSKEESKLERDINICLLFVCSWTSQPSVIPTIHFGHSQGKSSSVLGVLPADY